MKYEKVIEGKFIERPNRFIAAVEVEGIMTFAHVKNTGRCRELLVPGAKIYLEDFIGRMGERKHRYSLIGVEKNTSRGTLMVNMDSQAPNKVIKASLENGELNLPGMSDLTLVKPESAVGKSRLDFYVEDDRGSKAFIEVKGVTLENNGEAMFPDASTERGIRHLEELSETVRCGYLAFVIFVIQMDGIKCFRPNDAGHRAFGDALRRAEKNGVIPLAYQCVCTPDSMKIKNKIKIIL